MSSAWQVRAGPRGERDEEALNEGLAILGWDEMPDLSGFPTKSALRAEIRRRYEAASVAAVGNWTGQLWRFSHEMTDGDLVVMPLKSRGLIAVGEITGPYRYREQARPGFRHARPVRWIRTDVERDEFGPDLRDSMGSLLTVCRLTRHESVRRVTEIAHRRPDPGWRHESASLDPDATRAELWQAVESDAEPVRLTVRELLAKWNVTRRTATSLDTVQADLADQGLATRPPFTTARLDSVVELVPIAVEPDSTEQSPTPIPQTGAPDTAEPDELPIKWLVNAVLPADSGVDSVQAGSPLAEAITRMLAMQYSQLAVLDADGNCEGAVSWESIGRAQLNEPAATLADATAKVEVVHYDDDLFDQIDKIYKRGFVFVQGEDRRTLTGIVTAHDLVRQFGVLARPFSLIEEAELRLRRQVKATLPEDLITKYLPRWANGDGNPTFGKYRDLLTDPSVFTKLGWPLHHKTFLDLLGRISAIRNELMHFSQDTLPTEDLAAVEGFVAMLRAVDKPT